MAFSRTNCPYPSDIPANGSANGSSPREKFLGTSENTRWKLRWVEEVGPQPESRAIANAKWLRDNFCLSSTQKLRKVKVSLLMTCNSLRLIIPAQKNAKNAGKPRLVYSYLACTNYRFKLCRTKSGRRCHFPF